MKYINIFHANLNYAYLTPDMYEFVSYAKILYASEYTIRAEALAEARRVVGGIKIEDANRTLKKNNASTNIRKLK